MAIGAPGLVHLLDADLQSICGGLGLMTTLTSRCTCRTCLAIWNRSKPEQLGRALVTDDEGDEIGH